MRQVMVFMSFKSGLIVALLDGIAACINAYLQRRVGPLAVFRYIATGVFEAKALSGGAEMAWWGLLFHFTIAIGWTFIFFNLYLRIKIFQANKFFVGLAYGIFVWLGMNLVILRLSNVPPITYKLIPTSIMIGIHMFVVGLSISLLANYYFLKMNLKL